MPPHERRKLGFHPGLEKRNARAVKRVAQS
jgi:hypothetical protein